MSVLCNFMSKENWLSMLQVGKTWCGRISIFSCLGDESFLQVQNLRCDFEHMLNCVESKICCYLIITGTASAQGAADITELFSQTPLESAMNILIAIDWKKLSLSNFGDKFIERSANGRCHLSR
jgi:hypothetical protein